MSTRNSIRKLYDEKKDFIIIGLTGRTGSGCSTVAEILATKEYSDLKLRDPKTHDFNNSEEIKYSIIHKYAKESGNWKPFRIIRMTSIITLFMIKKGYDSFVDYLDEINKGLVEFKLDEIKIKLESFSFNDKYKSIHDVYGIIKENKEYSRYPYLISELDNFTRDLKNILEGFGCKSIEEDDEKDHISYSHFYTYLYQKIGNNIRASGDPFCEEFKEDKFFSLAEKCNEIIECIKKYDKSINKPTFICIDAIRNPYEAIFFRDRYADFYLISVNTDDSTRRSRLKDLRVDEINSLDEREYAKKIKGAQKFYNQDIGACLEISDIHVYNPNTEDYFFLTEQLLKYYVLMIHPGLITPTHLERCMQIAYNAKLNSGCLSRQVGAVVTNEDYSIVSIGWNEVPKGQISCSLRDVSEYNKNKDESMYSQFERTDKDFTDKMKEIGTKINYDKLEGRKHPYCFKDIYNSIKEKDNQVYTRALHAEENAFLQIVKYGGMGVKGGYLFTTASPCELCSKKASQLGIKTIYYIDPYPGISESHILNSGLGSNPNLQLFYGAIGNAYISLYKPNLPLKDELEFMIGSFN